MEMFEETIRQTANFKDNLNPTSTIIEGLDWISTKFILKSN